MHAQFGPQTTRTSMACTPFSPAASLHLPNAVAALNLTLSCVRWKHDGLCGSIWTYDTVMFASAVNRKKGKLK